MISAVLMSPMRTASTITFLEYFIIPMLPSTIKMKEPSYLSAYIFETYSSHFLLFFRSNHFMISSVLLHCKGQVSSLTPQEEWHTGIQQHSLHTIYLFHSNSSWYSVVQDLLLISHDSFKDMKCEKQCQNVRFDVIFFIQKRIEKKTYGYYAPGKSSITQQLNKYRE